MLVFHGLWSRTSGAGLWAEDPGRNVTSPSEALRTARPHPFAASAEELSATYPGSAASATLLLPSLRRSPLDSPELVRVVPRPTGRSDPSLLPWTVPVLRVTADAVAEQLADPERRGEARHAASVHFLVELARFADELVDRGRVLPTVVRASAGPLACWRPVLQGPDVVALHVLVTAMPPAFRAEPGSQDPPALVEDALRALTDAAVRRRLPGDLEVLPRRRGRRPLHPPAVEAWLEALRGPDARIAAEEPELRALEEALAPWAEVGTGRTAPAHVTFRLAEAGRADDDLFADDDASVVADDAGDPPADAPWRLEVLLQSTADPSLLVPAAQVWRDDGALRRWFDRPQELLLGDLGRALRVYPELEAGLRQAEPTGLDLDATGAFQFLSTAAPALEEAGFGVLLPSWWGPGPRLGLALSAHTPHDGDTGTAPRFGRDQLCEFHWQLAVGDHGLSEEEIAALAAAKAPLVRLRGQWVAVNTEQLRRGIEFLERQRTGQATAVEILRLATGHAEDLDLPLEVTAVHADGWLGALLAGTAAQTIRPVAPPEGFGARLRPYQERGLSWLSFLSDLGLGACLADDMGLGKTVQLLALEATERADRADAGPTLLICPMSLVGNWETEAARFAPGLRVHVHHGPERRRGVDLTAVLAEVDLLVTTYATATRDIDELAEVAWERIVLDEAQAIKNRLSRSARAVHRLGGRHRVALTGTPVENRLTELFSIMDFLNPGLLGSPELFRTRYAVPVERHGDDDAARRLRTVTRPYLLRRVKTDPSVIDDLPEKIEIKQYCQLTTEQASLYQSVVDDMLERIETTTGIERRGNVLAAMAKLKQVCNHPAQLLHDRSAIGQRSGKIIRLEEILEEILAEGDKVLCFTQYTEFAEMLLPHLAARFDTDVAYLHGGTSRRSRTEMVRRFQADDGPPIFLLSLRAGGTGLNLTAASHVIHLDRWWNPAVENQATDRAFRIGQRRRVQVRKFICRGTLEERIDAMIEDKSALADLVVGDGEGWLTELSTGKLRELFALSSRAVGE